MPSLRPSYLPLFTALLIAVLLATLASRYGWEREGLTALLRFSARMSFTLFVLWLALPPLARLAPGRFGSLATQVPQLLVSFAVAHSIHLLVIAQAARHGYFAELAGRDLYVTVIGGGLAYAFLLAMAFTAYGAPAFLRGRPCVVLHRGGAVYILLVFTNSYVGRLREGEAFAAVALVALAVAVLLRFAAWRRDAAMNARAARA